MYFIASLKRHFIKIIELLRKRFYLQTAFHGSADPAFGVIGIEFPDQHKMRKRRILTVSVAACVSDHIGSLSDAGADDTLHPREVQNTVFL